MAFTLIKNDLKTPNLWGMSTLNPIAEVQTLFPQKNFFNANAVNFISRIDIVEQLPFKVRITAIGNQGYDRSNPASVGVAVIGYSNYIL
jgi:hypothetical protein